MNFAHIFYSLRTKLFALVFFSILLITIPTITLTYSSIRTVSTDAEEVIFGNALILIEDNINSRYLNLVAGEMVNILERKLNLQKTALLAQSTWYELDWLKQKEKQKVLKGWANSLLTLDTHFGIYKNSKALIPSFLFELIGADKSREDFKRQPFSNMLKASKLPKEGMYAIFTLDKTDVLSLDNVPGIVDIKQATAINSLLSQKESVSVIMYFLPINADSVIVLASILDDIQERAALSENAIVKSIQEKFNNLEFYPNSMLSLISGSGEILAKRGEICEVEVNFFLKEMAEKVREEKTMEFAYDGAINSSIKGEENPFVKTFGSIVVRVIHFKALDWYILATVPVATIEAPSMSLLYKLSLITFVIIALCLFTTFVLAYRIAKPLQSLTNKAQVFANSGIVNQLSSNNKENASQILLDMSKDLPLTRQDEVGHLANAFSNMGKALDENIRNLMASKLVTERIQGELNAARDIQMDILPSPADAPHLTHYEIAAFLEPAKEVGGDLYDFFVAPDGRQVVVIGDVSGKGVGAALFMSMTVTLVRYAIASNLAPHVAMEQINEMLSRNNTNCMFVTLFIGIYDTETGDLEYANGGHCLPCIVSKSSTEVKFFDHLSGTVVGPLEGISYSLGKGTLNKGEICLLYSDGVSEAMNEQNELYSETRMYELLLKHQDAKPQALIEYFYEDILLHRGQAEASDDITMLAFMRLD